MKLLPPSPMNATDTDMMSSSSAAEAKTATATGTAPSVATATATAAATAAVSEEEERLRERLKAKKESRRPSTSSGNVNEEETKEEKVAVDNSKKAGQDKKNTKKNGSDHPRHSPREQGSHQQRRGSNNSGAGPGAAGGRSSSYERRSRSRERHSHHHARGGGRGGDVWPRGQPQQHPHPPLRGPPPPGYYGGVAPAGGYGPGPGPHGHGPPPPHWRGGGGPGGPPYSRGGPPGGPRNPDEEDDYGRIRRPTSSSSPRGRTSSRSPRSNIRSRSRSRDRKRSRSYSSHSSASSRSNSRSPSRSRSRDRDRRSHRHRRLSSVRNNRRRSGGGGGGGGGGSNSRRHSSSRRSRSRSSSVSSHSSSGSSSSGSYSDSDASSDMDASKDDENNNINGGGSGSAANEEFTKDQRTVFVSQLVQRTTDRDLKKYFNNKGCKVVQVILLRDKRTGRHKGCAYVELKRIQDLPTAVALSGQAPDFQRFPLSIKPSEAEKNYVASKSQTTLTNPTVAAIKPMFDENGVRIEAQKVYVGSLSPTVTQEQLFALFSKFGQLEKVSMQMDASTGASKGFAFLSFVDPKDANLAIQTMSNQSLAGRQIKTGWASQQAQGVKVVTSAEFPPNASARAQQAYQVLAQLSMGIPVTSMMLPTSSMAQVQPQERDSSVMMATTPGMAAASTMASATVAQPLLSTTSSSGIARVPTVAEARASLAAGASSAGIAALMPLPPATTIAAVVVPSIENQTPTSNILVHNMYDKDEETNPGWEKEIQQEFQEECIKYGTIKRIVVMHKEVGGKIYASFDTVEGAKNCACVLQGRWFDKRQLRVEYVGDQDVPPAMES